MNNLRSDFVNFNYKVTLRFTDYKLDLSNFYLGHALKEKNKGENYLWKIKMNSSHVRGSQYRPPGYLKY